MQSKTQDKILIIKNVSAIAKHLKGKKRFDHSPLRLNDGNSSTNIFLWSEKMFWLLPVFLHTSCVVMNYHACCFPMGNFLAEEIL